MPPPSEKEAINPLSEGNVTQGRREKALNVYAFLIEIATITNKSKNATAVFEPALHPPPLGLLIVMRLEILIVLPLEFILME